MLIYLSKFIAYFVKLGLELRSEVGTCLLWFQPNPNRTNETNKEVKTPIKFEVIKSVVTGIQFEIVKSGKSAVPEGQGLHLILQPIQPGAVPDPDGRTPGILHADIDSTTAGMLLAQADTYAKELTRSIPELEPDKYIVSFNGAAAVRRPHWHVHIILFGKDVQNRPLVKSAVDDAPYWEAFQVFINVFSEMKARGEL